MNQAIFWDLQGTLGGDAVASIERFEPYPFARDALKLAKEHGYRNIVITNQSRIGKGSLSAEAYEREARRIMAYFNAGEALLEEMLCCPHQTKDQCDCKKPRTGLIRQSVRKYGLDIERCVVIGDMGKNEIVMARHAGCRGVLVLTGGGRDSLGVFRDTWRGYEADFVAENALEAVRSILDDDARARA